MKKLIITLLVLLALFAGILYFLMNKGDVQFRCDAGYRFVPSTQTCELINQNESKGLDFSKVKLNIPETVLEVELTQVSNSDKYTGKYESTNTSNNFYVDLDNSRSVKFSDELVLAPFYINSGGSGQFLYVGLFDSSNNTHISSSFIGDRVSIDKIDIVNDKVKINFKTRLNSENFSVTPTIPAQIVLEIKDKAMNLVMGLQNADYSDVEIKSPLLNTEIKETLLIKGAIPGSWYFEAVANYQILNSQNEEIAFGFFEALSDWMTTQRVPFEVSITTQNINYKGKATLIIMSENVEGSEIGERLVKKLYIPIEFK